MKRSADERRAYRLDLAYDGTSFRGWQSQKDGSGVQDHVERALATFLREPVRVIGASRTDSGVHAEHQVALFRASAPFEGERWMRSLDALLPEAVCVLAVARAEPDFHPITSAKCKTYRYRLWLARRQSPWTKSFVWHLPQRFDLEALRAAATRFVGTHDFRSFAASDGSAKTTVRTIKEIHVDARLPLVDVWVTGDGFLKQMVRNLVGTMVACAQGRARPEDIPDILAGRDRRLAFETAPAHGLSLVRIHFDDTADSASLRQEAAGGLAWPLGLYRPMGS